MIRVIVFTIIGMGAFAGYSFLIFALGVRTQEAIAKKNGMAGIGGMKMLGDADKLFAELVEPTSLTSPSFVDSGVAARIGNWRNTYGKWREKK